MRPLKPEEMTYKEMAERIAVRLKQFHDVDMGASADSQLFVTITQWWENPSNHALHRVCKLAASVSTKFEASIPQLCSADIFQWRICIARQQVKIPRKTEWFAFTQAGSISGTQLQRGGGKGKGFRGFWLSQNEELPQYSQSPGWEACATRFLLAQWPSVRKHLDSKKGMMFSAAAVPPSSPHEGLSEAPYEDAYLSLPGHQKRLK